MLKAIINQKWKINREIVSFKVGDSLEKLSEVQKAGALKLGCAIKEESKVFNPVQENKAIEKVEEKKEDECNSELIEIENIEEVFENVINKEKSIDKYENFEMLIQEIELEEDKGKLIKIAQEYNINIDGRSSLSTIKTKILEILK